MSSFCDFCNREFNGSRGVTSHQARKNTPCHQQREIYLQEKIDDLSQNPRYRSLNLEDHNGNGLQTPPDASPANGNILPPPNRSTTSTTPQPSGSPYDILTDPEAAQQGPRKRTRWENLHAESDPTKPYFPWGSREEFDLVAWFTLSKLSASEVDKFMRLSWVQNAPVLSFSSAKDMNERIEHAMHGGPTWQSQVINLPEAPNEPQILFYRDAHECVDFLFGNPSFETEMLYDAVEVFESGTTNRVYKEMPSGNLWNEAQDSSPKGSTITGVILASDKTHLTNFSGDKSMYPVYISIGNIPSEVRRKTTRRAYLVLAYLPVTKFPNTDFAASYQSAVAGTKMPGILTRRLFHQCLSIVLAPLRSLVPRTVVDAAGFERQVVVQIISYIADLEEQWMLAALRQNECIPCVAGYHDLDSYETFCHRTSTSILAAIARARSRNPHADAYEFALNAKDEGLCGVEEPWWADFPLDICRVLCQDALHGLHKAFSDHDLKWITETIGEDELDRRIRVQPRRSGARRFPKGISHISQWSGKENRDVQRIILGSILGVETAIPIIKAVRSRLDFIYLAQSPRHTKATLGAMTNALTLYNVANRIYITNESRCGKNGPIDHMKIPKLHTCCHYHSNIEDTGSIDNYSAETSETLHIESCKDPYRESNRKDYMTQVLRRLTRHENINSFISYLRWRDDIVDANSVLPTPDCSTELGHCKHIRHAIAPHHPATSCLDARNTFSAPGLLSAITSYEYSRDCGLALHTREPYRDDELPPAYTSIDIWKSFRLHRPMDNPSKVDAVTIRCKPAKNGSEEIFDPVLVRVKGESSERVDLKDCRAAELRLIFRANQGQPMLAYIHWFSPIPSVLSGAAKFHQIHKQLWAHNQRAGGVVPLESIISYCPLSPVIDGICDPSLSTLNALSQVDTFYLNCFDSKDDYFFFA